MTRRSRLGWAGLVILLAGAVAGVGVVPAHAQDDSAAAERVVGRHRFATYNIGDPYYKGFIVKGKKKTLTSLCATAGREDTTQCKREMQWPLRKKSLLKRIGWTDDNPQDRAPAGKAATVIALQENKGTDVYPTTVFKKNSPPALTPYYSAVGDMMRRAGYTEVSSAHYPTGTAAKRTTKGTKLYYYTTRYHEIPMPAGSNYMTSIDMLSEAEYNRYAITMDGDKIVETESVKNKCFPIAKLRVVGASADEVREQFVVGAVHLPCPTENCFPTDPYQGDANAGARMWVQGRMTKVFALKVKSLARAGDGTDPDQVIPAVVMGDFNGFYGTDSFTYGTPTMKAKTGPTVMADLKFVDSRAAKFKQTKKGQAGLAKWGTVNTKKCAPGNVYDYIFYWWPHDVKEASRMTTQDKVCASDHRKYAVTLRFYREGE
jgi:hypothetical protein